MRSEYKGRNIRKKRKKKLIILLSVLMVLTGAAAAAAIVLTHSQKESDKAYAKEREKESQEGNSQIIYAENSTADIGFEIADTVEVPLEGSLETDEPGTAQDGGKLQGKPSDGNVPDSNTESNSNMEMNSKTELNGDSEMNGRTEPDGNTEMNGRTEPDGNTEMNGRTEPDGNTETDGNTKTNNTANNEESPFVPESDAVEETYFDDAVFIGDSRVDGFRIQSGLKNAQYLTAKGMNVKAIFNEKYVKVDGTKMTVLDALKKMKFSKVYIKLGINELGWKYPEVFAEDYAKLIDSICEINPHADIYVQSIIVVSKNKSDKDSTYNNKNIKTFNDLLIDMAEEKGVGYLDLNEVLADEDGNLPEGASFDGVHLTPDYCKIWLEYLKNHVMVQQEEDE